MPAAVTEDIFVSKIVYNYSGTLPAKASIKLNVGKAYAGQTLYTFAVKAKKMNR